MDDPFKNMIFSPEICYSLKRDIWYFDIKLNGINNNYVRTKWTLIQPRYFISTILKKYNF